ncbi:putative quinol monooxygenase [Xenorhabdus sp. KJ12.1]|uniref:putative quinol monooxygenase n=1 Tax=Xenorhabdus sp. KJ12.1 TaxID=1851571 RepID=UPI000C057210|nr:antibiotic biosynthesis monooxygenase [Xenorhabdus sp. KJ12.1]PHM70733.1 antibiotic biosynthesis monooxygenase [Xenorhabdus sp. KJ12.1]
MITAIVKAKILSGKEDELRNIANVLQFEYAPLEKGCHRYESFIDGDTFITIETWENQSFLDVHLEQEHVKKYVPKMRSCVIDEIFNVTFIDGGMVTQTKI